MCKYFYIEANFSMICLLYNIYYIYGWRKLHKSKYMAIKLNESLLKEIRGLSLFFTLKINIDFKK